jgi:hypothetical protein
MFKQTLCNLSLKRDNYVKITLSNDGVRWVLHFSSSATEVQVTPSPIPLEAFAKGVEEVIASVNRCEVKWGISLGGGALVADVEREWPRIRIRRCVEGVRELLIHQDGIPVRVHEFQMLCNVVKIVVVLQSIR